MTRLVIGVAILVAVVLAARFLQRRPSDAPTRGAGVVPDQLDRTDFSRPDAEWLVAVFTSATCLACADTVQAAQALDSPAVSVEVLAAETELRLHRRYRIDAVPTLVIADRTGQVRGSFIGPPGASRLWSTMAELRDQRST